MKENRIAILSASFVLLVLVALLIPDSLIIIKVVSYLIGIALMILVFSDLVSHVKLNSTLGLILLILVVFLLMLVLIVGSVWFVFY